MKNATRALVASCAVFTASVSSLSAQTLTNIDYTAQSGTTWNDASVRLDFGNGIGMGTITFQSINGGSFDEVQANAPYNAAPYSTYNGSTTLSGGAIFAPEEEVIFRILPNSSAVGLSGFLMTVALDSGMFPAGSMFSIRSLGFQNATNYQQLALVSGLQAADPVRLPTDDAWPNGEPDLVESSTGVYTVDRGPDPSLTNHSNSLGRAFAITGNSFSVQMLSTSSYIGGGEAFTIVTPVPEPSAVISGIAGLGAMCLVRRRR